MAKWLKDRFGLATSISKVGPGCTAWEYLGGCQVLIAQCSQSWLLGSNNWCLKIIHAPLKVIEKVPKGSVLRVRAKGLGLKLQLTNEALMLLRSTMKQFVRGAKIRQRDRRFFAGQGGSATVGRRTEHYRQQCINSHEILSISPCEKQMFGMGLCQIILWVPGVAPDLFTHKNRNQRWTNH